MGLGGWNVVNLSFGGYCLLPSRPGLDLDLLLFNLRSSLEGVGVYTSFLYRMQTFSRCCEITSEIVGRSSFARTGGSFCTLTSIGRGGARLILPSGKARVFSIYCSGVSLVGQFGGVTSRGAGSSFHLGWRPRVRQVAKNAIDRAAGCRKLSLPWN